MHITIKIVLLQIMLGASLPAFSCSIAPGEPEERKELPQKYSIDFYKESSTVVTAKVIRIIPSATKMSQLGIEASFSRLKTLREKETDERILEPFTQSVDSVEKDYLRRKNNPGYAEIKGVHEYSGPIRVEMTINKSFKGKFKEGDTIHFTANYRPSRPPQEFQGWGDCGDVGDASDDFYEDYLYSAKSNQQVALYYSKGRVTHWVEFENTEAQHEELNRYSTADTFVGKVSTMFKSFINGK